MFESRRSRKLIVLGPLAVIATVISLYGPLMVVLGIGLSEREATLAEISLAIAFALVFCAFVLFCLEIGHRIYEWIKEGSEY